MVERQDVKCISSLALSHVAQVTLLKYAFKIVSTTLRCYLWEWIDDVLMGTEEWSEGVHLKPDCLLLACAVHLIWKPR